jgi:hypothetical protein
MCEALHLFTSFIIEGLEKIYLAIVRMYQFPSFGDKLFHFCSSALIPMIYRYVTFPLALLITTALGLPDRFFYGI